MRSCFLALAICSAVLPAAAQMMAPVGVDLFGDSIVKRIAAAGEPEFSIPVIDAEVVPDGYPHTLQFHDGRQLRGMLAELTKDDVQWTRPDANTPLRFSRAEIRRIVFSADSPVVQNRVPGNAKRREGKDVPATVKLPGGDWLFGDARAENGENFTVSIASGASLAFSRAAVQWLYFGSQPAPAFGFAGEPLGMEGWIFGNPSTPAEVVDGMFKLQGNGWIGRDISPPDRFEIDFEVPDTREPTRLWLQPYRPSPNSYSTGTIELSFAQKELTRLIFINRFEREKTEMPKEQNASGLARYRVFYDGPGERLVVLRNGTLVGDWKLRDEANAAAAGGHNAPRAPKGICFDRANSSSQLVLGRVRLQPWDGVIPKEGLAPESRIVSGGPPKPGKFEALSEAEVIFGGERMARREGMFIHLAQTPAGLRDGDALVTFGTRGELATADLVIREGRLLGRTAAIANLDLPVNLIHGVIFPKRQMEALPVADVLVFRNGDSLQGQLIAAGKGVPLQWRSSGGQELTFEDKHVAGVRLGGGKLADGKAGSTVELLNGDRLRGEVISLTGEELRLRHPTLGERAVPRNLLKALYPNPKALILDAGSDPEGWLGLTARGKPDLRAVVQKAEAIHGRVYLDGVFLNPPAQGSATSFTGISRVLDGVECYELRCEATDSGGAEPYLSGSLAGSNGTPSLQFNLGHGQLRIYAYNLSGGRGRGMQQRDREVRLADKLPEQRSRRELRIFVNTKLGTADFIVDGVHLLRFGEEKTERAAGLGKRVSLSTYSMRDSVSILSNVWLGPWNGDVPRPGQSSGGATLNNGDIATGVLGDLQDGTLAIGEGADLIKIPIERITSMNFGGVPAPKRHVARVRLGDGTVLNLSDFQWEKQVLRGENAAFGKLELPAGALREVILAPAPARSPMLSEPKRMVKKNQRGVLDGQP